MILCNTEAHTPSPHPDEIAALSSMTGDQVMAAVALCVTGSAVANFCVILCVIVSFALTSTAVLTGDGGFVAFKLMLNGFAQDA